MLYEHCRALLDRSVFGDSHNTYPLTSCSTQAIPALPRKLCNLQWRRRGITFIKSALVESAINDIRMRELLPTCAEVQRKVRLCSYYLTPFQELVCSKLIAFNSDPSKLRPFQS
jgi:hypothetical protein